MGNYGSVNVPGVSGPELEAVRAIANSALEKANEALEGGGGSGCVLKITFDAEFAGQEYTVTDGAGDTKTGTRAGGSCGFRQRQELQHGVHRQREHRVWRAVFRNRDHRRVLWPV